MKNIIKLLDRLYGFIGRLTVRRLSMVLINVCLKNKIHIIKSRLKLISIKFHISN